MNFPRIPRGPVIFITAVVVIIVLIAGYEFLARGASSNTTGTTTGGFFAALFPFGGGPAPAGNTGGNTNGGTSPETQSGPVPTLREVSASPVSGGWFASSTATTSASLIFFMDRGSGHITQTPADSQSQMRASNTTLPGVEEVYPVGDGAAVLRYIDGGVLQNVFGMLNPPTQSLSTFTLRPFNRVSVERGGNMLTVTEENGGGIVELSKPDGSKLQTLFTSPISSWVPLIGGGREFLETAPTAAATGYVYEIKNGALSKIGVGAPGLTANISPSGRYLAESGNTPDGFAFFVVDTNTGGIIGSPTHAFALKCAWVPNHEPLLFCAIPALPPAAAYPDDWLLGNVSFSDQAWILNPAKSTAYFIGNLTDDNGVALDAENISVDPAGAYALFINKKDLSLWSLKIEDVVARVAGL